MNPASQRPGCTLALLHVMDVKVPPPFTVHLGDCRVHICRPTAAHAAASDIVSRAVEAGAQLLAAPPHDVRVVMQLPRGNLETVAPRALVLAAIAESLQACRVSLACKNEFQQRLSTEGRSAQKHRA